MKRAFPSEFLTKNFNAVASQRANAKHRKRPSPVSIRVSDDERIQLQEWAGTTPIVRRQIIWDIRACFRLEALAHP